MSIFLNQKVTPKLYVTHSEIKHSSNQKEYRVSEMSVFIKNQQEVNAQLTSVIDKVNQLVEASQLEQSNNFATLLTRMEQQENVTKQLLQNMEDQPAAMMAEQLEQLTKSFEHLKKDIETASFVNQAIMDQLTFQNKTIRHLSRKLKEYETLYQYLLDQQHKQGEINKEISERLALQEAFHETIRKKLDEQKAQTQKISSQVEYLKATLSEYVNHIMDKIGNVYTLISNNLSGSNLAHLGLIKNNEQEKKEKETLTQK
ncbi:hypothetical protein GCM10010965_22610 [Caldalkalibacillus thermarum]|uniref:hypothetical protein n=1 Tax=Caldalkalibacillus thermarum TaxID=296745 RepID=UPI001669DCCF|nr:hypothetical protein [Caldalkalibacillus thermarum]GGK29232.1 hypothetical protein GCM10010965_22610 [Caldalkalibacillus thermarum]